MLRSSAEGAVSMLRSSAEGTVSQDQYQLLCSIKGAVSQNQHWRKKCGELPTCAGLLWVLRLQVSPTAVHDRAPLLLSTCTARETWQAAAFARGCWKRRVIGPSE
jgi:hypothetical protein